MKTKGIPGKLTAVLLVSVMVFGIVPAARAQPVTLNYGNVSLSGGFQAGHFSHIWDLTAGDLVVSFTVDLNGIVDNDPDGGATWDCGDHAWSELGVRDTTTTRDFNPGAWITGGKGVWLATDYDELWVGGKPKPQNTFAPDPSGAPTLDMDDKLILQRGGGADERYYDLPSSPPNPWANYGVWFDRDGVDRWQAQMWGCIDGGTYNTGGKYAVVIKLHATSATSGTVYMTINGIQQGFYVPGWHSGQPDIYPAGMTFTGDMARMQVFYGLYGYGATHTVVFEDITVTGHLATIEVAIDIKPGSYPNSINLKSKGVVPVAVLTTDKFDASAIDPATVRFAGAEPVRWTMEDVDSDGDLDMLFHFKTQDLNLTVDSTKATLTGRTTIGQPIQGVDTVKIVP